MSIFAIALRAQNFRSYEQVELDLSQGITVLEGCNAAGKTNLIEALQLLTAAQSFRHPSPTDLVHTGASAAHASLTLEGEGRHLDMGLEVRLGRRSYTRNGKRARTSEIRGILPSVLFCPDHLDLCKRGARVRRSALDDFGVQLNAQYADLVAGYGRTVEQRNSLLRDHASGVLLEAWDEALVSAGSALLQHRMALMKRVAAGIVDVYAAIAPGEQLEAKYCSTIPGVHENSTRAEIQSQFTAALHESRVEEARRGMTLLGPHRDDIDILLDGRSARSFASQGQQRSIALAWKIAEVQVTRAILGRYPLLLLDDVMSELDERRRSAIMEFVDGEIQTVITTTNLGYFTNKALSTAQVIHIGM